MLVNSYELALLDREVIAYTRLNLNSFKEREPYFSLNSILSIPGFPAYWSDFFAIIEYNKKLMFCISNSNTKPGSWEPDY